MGGGGEPALIQGLQLLRRGSKTHWVQIYPAIGRVELTASGQLL